MLEEFIKNLCDAAMMIMVSLTHKTVFAFSSYFWPFDELKWVHYASINETQINLLKNNELILKKAILLLQYIKKKKKQQQQWR